MKKKYKIPALVLTLALAIGMLPSTAFAGGIEFPPLRGKLSQKQAMLKESLPELSPSAGIQSKNVTPLNTKARAKTYLLGRMQSGVLSYYGNLGTTYTDGSRIHYYKFSVPADGRVEVNVMSTARGTAWRLSSRDDVDSGSTTRFYEQDGSTTYWSSYGGVFGIGSGTHYLQISSSARSPIVYSFAVAYQPDAPRLGTVLAPAVAKKAMTIKWKKATGKVSKYQVQYRKRGTSAWKTVLVPASRASYKATRLTTKARYQVRMRAYYSYKNVKYYSKWSAVKTSAAIK